MHSRTNFSPGAAIVAKRAGHSKNIAVGHRHRPDNPAAAALAASFNDLGA